MTDLRILTNGHVRFAITLSEAMDGALDPKGLRSDFDYITDEEMHDPRLVSYRGQFYDLHEAMAVSTHAPEEMQQWSGYISQGFGFGIVIRYVPDAEGEEVVVGRYY